MAGALVKEHNGWNGMWTLIRILDTCKAGGLTKGSVYPGIFITVQYA
jgi:hypothetical protein